METQDLIIEENIEAIANQESQFSLLTQSEVINSLNKFENNSKATFDSVKKESLAKDNSKYNNFMKEKLFEAVSKGNIEEVDNLLDLPYTDINTTWYSENLLMCAIRSNQEKMAQYLICKGVDVTHEVDLFEFREKNAIPINYLYYSCRDMAYDHGMHDIVNLIDFFNENTHWRIVQFIGKRFLKLDNKDSQNQNTTNELRRLYKKRLETVYLTKKSLISDDIYIAENGIDDENDEIFVREETKLYRDADRVKPKSNITRYEPSLTTVMSSNSLRQNSKTILKKDLNAALAKRFIQTDSNNFFLLNDVHKKKKVNFRGYKLTFDINYVNDYDIRDDNDYYYKNHKKQNERIKSAKKPLEKETHDTTVENITESQTKLLTNPKTVTFKPSERPKTSTPALTRRPKISLDLNRSYAKLSTTRKQVQESYLNSLKKSGLWNNNCTPIIQQVPRTHKHGYLNYKTTPISNNRIINSVR